MIYYFPIPYPDEIFYSWIARYARHTISDRVPTNRRVFGRKVFPANLDFPSGIVEICRKFEMGNYIFDDILHNHTLWPFYQNFIVPEKHQEILDAMKTSAGKRLVGRTQSCLRLPRYCPLCAREDVLNYHEMFWHRDHQIPDVLVCTKHNCLLKESNVDSTSLRWGGFIAATAETCPLEKFLLNDSDELLQIAEAMISVLKGEISLNFSTQNNLAIALTKGYQVKGSLFRADRNKLHMELQAHYQKVLIKYQEQGLYENGLSFTAAIEEPSKLFHPLKHVMMWLFLSSKINKPQEGRNHNFGSGPWPCVNRISNHCDRPIIKHISVDKTQSKKFRGTLTCSCGMVYTLTEGTNGRVRRVITEYGHVWKKYVQSQIDRGAYASSLCKDLGIDRITLVYWANRYSLKHPWKKRKITLHSSRIEKRRKIERTFWSKSLKNDNTISYLRTQHEKHHNWLWRNDREWLRNINADFRRKKKSVFKSPNWKELDLKRSVAIEKSALLLYNKNGRRRISKNLILTMAGLSQIRFDHKFPKSVVALTTFIETTNQFFIRRIKNRAKEILSEGGAVGPSIYSLCRLNKSKLSSAVIIFAEAIIAKQHVA